MTRRATIIALALFAALFFARFVLVEIGDLQ